MLYFSGWAAAWAEGISEEVAPTLRFCVFDTVVGVFTSAEISPEGITPLRLDLWISLGFLLDLPKKKWRKAATSGGG